jgi:hypothetical protein
LSGSVCLFYFKQFSFGGWNTATFFVKVSTFFFGDKSQKNTKSVPFTLPQV